MSEASGRRRTSSARPNSALRGKESSQTEIRYFVPALEKGLDILESLAAERVPRSLTDLARSLQRTPSELFRMLNVLERRGYIARDPFSDAYQLTLKLFELAHIHSPVDQLLKVAMIPMNELAETIRESCHLCVLSRSMLLVVAQAESPEPVRLSVEVGDRVQPLRTASGRVLCAFLDGAEQDQFLARDATWAGMNRQERGDLLEEFREIRRRGYLLAASTRRAGLDLSCVVGNARAGVVAALGVPFLPGSGNAGKERRLIRTVQRYADRITDALGISPMKARRSATASSGRTVEE